MEWVRGLDKDELVFVRARTQAQLDVPKPTSILAAIIPASAGRRARNMRKRGVRFRSPESSTFSGRARYEEP